MHWRSLSVDQAGPSGHQELHLGASEFQRVAMLQRCSAAADFLAVELEAGGVAFQLGQHEAVVLLGDGGHGHAGLAQGGDDLDQGDFAAGGVAVEHADGGLARGQAGHGGGQGVVEARRGLRAELRRQVRFGQRGGAGGLDGGGNGGKGRARGGAGLLLDEADLVLADVQ